MKALLGIALALVTLGVSLPARATEADLEISLQACEGEVAGLTRLATEYRKDGLVGDLALAKLRAQVQALASELQRLRSAERSEGDEPSPRRGL